METEQARQSGISTTSPINSPNAKPIMPSLLNDVKTPDIPLPDTKEMAYCELELRSSNESYPFTKDSENFSRLSAVLIEVVTKALRISLDKEIGSSEFKSLKKALTSLQKDFAHWEKEKPLQWDRLYPGGVATNDTRNFDLTILGILFRKILEAKYVSKKGKSRGKKGKFVWPFDPLDKDLSLPADIQRLIDIRNMICAHAFTIYLPKAEYEGLMDRLKLILMRTFDVKKDDIEKWETAPLSETQVEEYKNKIKQLMRNDSDFMLESKIIETKLQGIITAFQNFKSEVKDQIQSTLTNFKSEVKDQVQSTLIDHLQPILKAIESTAKQATQNQGNKRVDDPKDTTEYGNQNKKPFNIPSLQEASGSVQAHPAEPLLMKSVAMRRPSEKPLETARSDVDENLITDTFAETNSSSIKSGKNPQVDDYYYNAPTPMDLPMSPMTIDHLIGETSETLDMDDLDLDDNSIPPDTEDPELPSVKMIRSHNTVERYSKADPASMQAHIEQLEKQLKEKDKQLADAIPKNIPPFNLIESVERYSKTDYEAMQKYIQLEKQDIMEDTVERNSNDEPELMQDYIAKIEKQLIDTRKENAFLKAKLSCEAETVSSKNETIGSKRKQLEGKASKMHQVKEKEKQKDRVIKIKGKRIYEQEEELEQLKRQCLPVHEKYIADLIEYQQYTKNDVKEHVEPQIKRDQALISNPMFKHNSAITHSIANVQQNHLQQIQSNHMNQNLPNQELLSHPMLHQNQLQSMQMNMIQPRDLLSHQLFQQDKSLSSQLSCTNISNANLTYVHSDAPSLSNTYNNKVLRNDRAEIAQLLDSDPRNNMFTEYERGNNIQQEEATVSNRNQNSKYQ